MNSDGTRRHRKCLNLVELIRNRSRHSMRRSTPLVSRSSHRRLKNVTSHCAEPSGSLSRHSIVPLNGAQSEHTDKNIWSNDMNNCVQAESVPDAQVEIVPQLSVGSDFTSFEDKCTNTSLASIRNENSSCSSNSKTDCATHEVEMLTKATSTHSDVVFLMGQMMESSESCSPIGTGYSILESQPMNINENMGALNIEELTESEDDSAVEEASEESISIILARPEFAEVLNDLMTEELAIDEMAGGDGHHNDSAYEIVLTSSNETTSLMDEDNESEEQSLDESE